MGEHVRAGDLDIWTEQVGAGTGRPADRRAGRHRRVVAVPARRAPRPLPPHRLRQPRRGAHRAARRAGDGGGDGRRRSRGPARARYPLRARRRASRAAAPSRQELALRHPELVRSLVLQSTWRAGRLPARCAFCRWLVERRAERARVPRGILPGSTPRGRTRTARSTRSSRRRWRSRTSSRRRTFQRTLDAFMAHETTDRLHADRRADPGARRRGRHHAATALGRAVADAIPARVFEVMPERVAPAVPGGPGRVERPGRRLLARGRGA